MNRKTMPLLLMLIAGAVTSIITLIRNYSIIDKLVALLIAMIIFYFLGSILKWSLDRFDRQNELKKAEEGEVIEKEPDEMEEGHSMEE